LLLLLAAHLVASVAAPALVRWLGRKAFLVLAAVPASALGWALRWSGEVMDGDGPVESHTWVSHLGMTLSFRLDTLSWLMVLLVSGVGALVLVYSAGYFSSRAAGLGRFSGVLVMFAGSMLGLVTTDNLLLLYVFWELTTVASYLLIGHYAGRKASRRAAMQAIVVTAFGGLTMLVGIVLLGDAAGTYRISRIVAEPPSGTAVTVAVVLLLVGAASKSALVPFHFWLPSAMAAPTPVSAYLHAAAMVKAGVYLVARLAPAFAGLPVWRGIIIAVGSWTLVHGGYRALRQYDLKLVLAFGTVSQLGLLVLLVGLGTRAAALAGLAMLGAHAMFKASLFLIVGVVDVATGTRDMRRLDGVGRALPITAAVGALGVASMIGLPPFAGFVAKEAALDAVARNAQGMDVVVLVAMAVGSALTVAYGLRFWWGAFGPATSGVVPLAELEGAEPVPVRHPTAVLVLPAAVLAVLGLVLAVVPALADSLLAPYADAYPGEAGHLALWSGPTRALGLTGVILTAGALMFLGRARVERWQYREPQRVDADRIYRRLMRRVDDVAADVTAVTQRGSLPFYLGVILLVLAVFTGISLASSPGLVPGAGGVRLWDSPAQLIAGGLSVTAAAMAARSRRRIKAVILTGASGYGVAILFMLHGAPDLALTQVLVETITLVVLVLVLRRLPPHFSVRPLGGSRWVRLGIGLAVGLGVGGLAIAAPGVRTATPVSATFAEEAYVNGGGRNVVNVTIVDIRAWDTMGEISVLLVAATGVASLVFLRRRSGDILRSRDVTGEGVVWGGSRDPMAGLRNRPAGRAFDAARSGGKGTSEWLRASRTLAPQRRSIIVEIVVRLLYHSMIVVAIFLLFAGHNAPGGGFVAGLVVGTALIVRYLAGGRYELGEAAPVHPGLLLGSGLLLSAGVGLVALLAGGSVLESVILEWTVPVLGHVKLVTSLFFDIGVFLVVVGLVVDVLRSLGAEIDRQAEDAGEKARAGVGS
jgi:multicomponent Na+:H+ antiporter subunit A